MHLEPTCTGLSNVAINGIKELGRNAMLLCNVCIENNERDNFIRNRTVNNLEEKINKNMSSNAETLETQIAQIVEKKINEAMRKTHDKVDESYANVVKKVESYKNVNSPQNSKNNNNTITHSIEHNVRVQGIHEDPNKPRDVNLVQTSHLLLVHSPSLFNPQWFIPHLLFVLYSVFVVYSVVI